MSEKFPRSTAARESADEAELTLGSEQVQPLSEQMHGLIEYANLSPEELRAELRAVVERLKEAEQQAHVRYEMAYKDELTHLLNRRGFTEALNSKIERARKTATDKLYAFYIDIDGFKEINDTFGHQKGDQYLQLISKQLMTALRPDDTLGRIGGDEFTALCFIRHQPGENEEFNYDKQAKGIQERIRQAVYNAKLELLGEGAPELGRTVSIGLVQFDGVEGTDDLMNRADKVMYDIKKTKRMPSS